LAGCPDAIKNLIEGVARDNGYLELHTAGMRFGELIAQCEAAIRMILENDAYTWEDGEAFTIGDYH
jgi:hypothetical protein